MYNNLYLKSLSYYFNSNNVCLLYSWKQQGFLCFCWMVFKWKTFNEILTVYTIQYIRKASLVTNQAIPIYVVLIFLRWLTDLKHEIKHYFLSKTEYGRYKFVNFTTCLVQKLTDKNNVHLWSYLRGMNYLMKCY